MNALLSLLYPTQCVGCDARVDGDDGLCGRCWRETPFLDGLTCDCCGTPLLGPREKERVICDDCLAAPPPWSRGRAALRYSGEARKLVLALKHGGREDIARVGGQWMARAGQDILHAESVLVPVPIHRLRLAKRRYNQSALLAASVARVAGTKLALMALRRTENTPRAVDIPSETRFGVLERAITADRAARLEGCDVVIVDDVMTSGATLGAATKAAYAAGAKRVDILTLARAVRGD